MDACNASWSCDGACVTWAIGGCGDGGGAWAGANGSDGGLAAAAWTNTLFGGCGGRIGAMIFICGIACGSGVACSSGRTIVCGKPEFAIGYPGVGANPPPGDGRVKMRGATLVVVAMLRNRRCNCLFTHVQICVGAKRRVRRDIKKQMSFRTRGVVLRSSPFGAADEAVYYTLLLMPFSGNETLFKANGYTTTEIFEYWLANVETNSLLAEHSTVTLTQELVDSVVAFGAARALYKIVFAGDVDSRYVINPHTAQLPVPSREFLISIGVFDKEIAAQLATCRIVQSPSVFPAPALARGVLPPKEPRNFTLAVVLPQFATLGCPIATADVVAQALCLGNATGL